jgi:glycerol kinase
MREYARLKLREAGEEQRVRERTGLMLDPYFSATKIEWLLRNVDGLAERARDGRAVFGTVDSWMVYKLTGEHVTEPSNASRTLLMDIAKGAWDPELLALFGGIPERSLPELRPSCGVLGTTRPDDFHGFEVPVSGAAPGRLGMLSMRERADEIGAELSIVSSRGGGTRVEVRMRSASDRRPRARSAE